MFHLSIFAHICPCSSLFIPVPICDFPCSLKVLLVVAVSTSQRVGGRRLLWPTVSLRCEVGAQDGRQARRQIPVGALDTEKVAENISRTYRGIEKSRNQVDRDRSTFALCNALKPLTRLEMPHRWMKCCYTERWIVSQLGPPLSFLLWSVRCVISNGNDQRCKAAKILGISRGNRWPRPQLNLQDSLKVPR